MRKDNMPSHHGVKVKLDRQYPNRTMQLLLERASCRDFAEKEIPDDILRLVLETGIHAPSGGNLQPFSIIKIKEPAIRAKLAEMCDQNFIGKAPVNLLFCIDWHRLERWAKLEIAPYSGSSAFIHFWISFQDTIIAAQNICTAADAMDLGSVYIGTVADFLRELRDMFDLPDSVLPVVLLCLGYPKEKPQVRRKLALEVIVHDEKYHDFEDPKLIDAYNDKYPEVKIAISEERLDQIRQTCLKVHGQEFADRCLAQIKKQGYINMVQRYFGLHYRADEMPAINEYFLEVMEEYGFNWFKKWEPVKE